MKILRNMLLIVLFLSLQLGNALSPSMGDTLYSQPVSNGPYNAQQGKITGKVVSAEDSSPLSSASVSIKAADGKIITGATASKTGDFTISASAGSYTLEAKFVGYETHSQPVELGPGATLELGNIKLKMSQVMQDEVRVEAEKAAVEIGIDSKTFNVTKDLTTTGDNILDLLRKIPSVSVDLEDNIKMNGQAPKILINGRESQLSSKEMLKMQSSDIVESVELITNPSAKYESEGVSGIIDIKLKKESDNGFNGMVSAGGGGDFALDWSKNQNAGIYANYKHNKLNLFANVWYYGYYGRGEAERSRTIWPLGDTTYSNSFGTPEYDGGGGGGSFGAEYELTDNDVLTFDGYLGVYGNNNSGGFLTKFTNARHEFLYSLSTADEPRYKNLWGGLSISYKREFEEKGHNLYVDLFWNKTPAIASEVNNEQHYVYNELYYPTANIDKYYLSTQEYPSDGITLKADYERTLELLGNFGAGFRINRGNDRHKDRTSILQNGVYVYEPLVSDEYKYDDGVYAAYFTLGKKWEHFSYRVGLRAEYTDWTFNSIISDTTVSDNYMSWAPSVHLKYMLGMTHTFGVSYSRRLDRPWYSQFNPYIAIMDSTSFYSGNPDLKESYYNSYQVDYMFFTAATTVTLAAFYNHTDNGEEYFSEVTPWGGIWSYPINAAKVGNLGGSVSLNQKITEKWDLSAFGSLFSKTIDAENIGIAKRTETSWSVNFNSTYRALDNLRFQLSGYYSPASISLQGESTGWYSINAGVNYSILDDKLTFNLNFRNLIFPNNSEDWTYGENFAEYTNRQGAWQQRGFYLGISYKINDYKPQDKRSDEGGSGPQQGGGPGGGM